jgi:hypothetical protein
MRVLLAALLAASGCATQNDIVAQYRQMRPDIAAGNYQAAVEKLKAARGPVYEEGDRVAYWLNLGTLQHYAGDHEASMQSLVSAEETMQELWTKSISEEIARFVISDASKTYAGEDFERILVYFYTALNRVEQGRIQDALVEARRADEQLKRMRIAYEKDGGLGTAYVQDAFMLWLVGVFYELEGSYNDAFLAYREAESVYRKLYARRFATAAPAFLGEDLVRTARLANLGSEGDALARRFAVDGHTVERWREGWAEIVLIHGSGEAPYKVEESFTGVLPGGQVVRVAIPRFVPVPHSIASAELDVGGRTGRTQVVEPVARIATEQFRTQLPGIKARAIARAAVKYAAVAGVKRAVGGGRNASSDRQLAGAVVGLLGSLAGAAAEAADLRAWTTLPAEFGATRLWLPPGEHDVQVRFQDRRGRTIGQAPPLRVRLGPRERRILSVRSLR